MERTGDPSDGASDGAADDDGTPLPPWLAFERRILVKREAPALLRRALAGRSARVQRLLSGEEALVVGTATDPYQPAERRFRVTRGVLEVLAEHPGLRVVIITKSPLVARDVDVLARIARHSSLSVHVSLITLDRALARRVEPRAPTPESRLRAVAQLAAAGVDVGINCMPVLPGITDRPRGPLPRDVRPRPPRGRRVPRGAARVRGAPVRAPRAARARVQPRWCVARALGDA